MCIKLSPVLPAALAGGRPRVAGADGAAVGGGAAGGAGAGGATRAVRQRLRHLPVLPRGGAVLW